MHAQNFLIAQDAREEQKNATVLFAELAGDLERIHASLDHIAANSTATKVAAVAHNGALLNSMCGQWTEKIAEAARREETSYKNYGETMKQLEATRTNNPKYDSVEKYWKKERELAHRQYHTALKIMHAGRGKFKSVGKAMRDAAAGKKLTQLMPAPEVVLLQQQVASLKTWIADASAQIRDAQARKAPETPSQ
eukprot:NODE_1318_length_1177_cov_210.524955.p2 GENE.NODE_1318_length_1177_cov_210.524955~~NODE_1318_length_1177_cov_210.524955.p2  ORF type:complete len:194 (-),score=85.80 NODE_1318_length_1177_cov_210.524955:342-923(-)